MKKLIALLATSLIATASFAAGLTVIWTNDASNPPGTQTVVYYGVSPGIYTNSVTVAPGVSTVTITNLSAGVRYYVAAKATDGTDFSDYSNEANAKTKLNPPKSINAVAQ